jgi:hypothetical protein
VVAIEEGITDPLLCLQPLLHLYYIFAERVILEVGIGFLIVIGPSRCYERLEKLSLVDRSQLSWRRWFPSALLGGTRLGSDVDC